MADKPLRRHIVIVLEIDQDGNPGEINRAHASDEYIGRSGGIEMSPAANVDESNLAALLPDVAGFLAQLAAAHAAREAALKAKADSDALLAERDARIAELEARLAVPPPVDDSIHAAYVKQALDDMKRLDEVVGAAIVAGYYQLWDNATSFTLREPMVVAIAGNLGIDLAEVRTRALAIKGAVPLSGNSGE